MPGITGVASRRARSAGTLLVFGGGLALYQMTSLVLGPAGSRQLDLSLTIPAVDADEWTGSWAFSNNLALGMVVAGAPAPSVTPSRQALGRPAEPGATAASAPAPIVATPPALPAASEPATRHGHCHPQPPKHHNSH